MSSTVLPRILITGATGSTGLAVAASLQQAGVPFRAMVRKQADSSRLMAKPAELAVANFDDNSITDAVVGIDRAYLVTPSSENAEQQQLRFIDAAIAAGVQHIVLLSQLGADIDSPVRFLRYHAVVEQRLEQLSVGYTFLRPNLFFQGLFAFKEGIAATGNFAAPIGNTRVSAIDVRDIGDVAAAALTQSGHLGKTYTLTGPDSLTHQDIATSLTRATRSQITFSDVEPNQFGQYLQGILPSWQVDGLLEDYAHYRRGEAAQTTNTVTEITGKTGRCFDEFATEFSAEFVGD